MKALWSRIAALARLSLVAIGIAAAIGGATAAGAGEIHDLVQRGDVAQVKAFIEAHPDLVNAKDDRNCTPLHFSVNKGDVELVRFLVDKGADMTARDADGDSPLHWAALYGKPEIADLLVSRAAAGEFEPRHSRHIY